jgi:hypothetical protein
MSLDILAQALMAKRSEITGIDLCAHFKSSACFVCKDKADGLSTTTLVDAKSVMMVFSSCLPCRTKADSFPSWLHFLAETKRIPIPLPMIQQLTRKDAVDNAVSVLQNRMACTVIEANLPRSVVHAKRSSGVKITVRLSAPDDYAYMVFDAQGNQRTRVDSAKHHHVAFGPDHIHRQVSKQDGQGSIEGAVTYGLLAADWRFVLAEIEKIEVAPT